MRLGRAIHLPLLDFFLACEYQRSRLSAGGNSKFYYVDRDAVKGVRGTGGDGGYALRVALGGNPDDPVPDAPVLLLIEQGAGYFLVIFGFHARKALILGRSGNAYLGHPEWESWNGLALWKNIGLGFGWARCCEDKPQVYERDWIPVSAAYLARFE